MADLVERLRLPILLITALAILIAAFLIYLRMPKNEGEIEVIMPASSPTPDYMLKVYVSGAVVQPGVYRLAAGDRVEDAVKAAGGATAEGDLDAVNLAARVRDEMHIYVPKQGEVTVNAGAGGASQKISISSATSEQLESLPGVGPVTAKRIVDYRSKNGSFKTIEELLDLKLVNSSTFEKIKDLIAP